MNLYEKLVEYSKQTYYPFHMPGHKRNEKMVTAINPYALDITEIDGFDNLHHANEILLELCQRIARLYQAWHSYPLINGSTCGILAGISAATKAGDEVLIARNSHKSVYHGLLIKNLVPRYIYPERIPSSSIFGGVSAEEIKRQLKLYPKIKLVLITSPTYEGMVSDIATIAKIVHDHGAYLMVDEAHGAHFGFHKMFPKSAVICGADIVIHSIHKTLASFTQTAMLHLNCPQLKDRVETYLGIYQSSSPSYVLMSGIDRCISLLESKKTELFHSYSNRLNKLYHEVSQLKEVELITKDIVSQYEIYDFDPSKLIIRTKEANLSGPELSKILREKYGLVMEMDGAEYTLGMTTYCDTSEGFERLKDALFDIDTHLHIDINQEEKKNLLQLLHQTESIPNSTVVMTPAAAYEAVKQKMKLEESQGQICASQISIYPPGIPLLFPGERMNREIIEYIKMAQKIGQNVTGLLGENKEYMNVILQ